MAKFLGKDVALRPTENYKQRIGRKSSLVEFYKAPLRYLKESITVESAFEKPYLGKDYILMHLDIPAPDWPTWNFSWEISRRRGRAAEIPDCRGCGINHWNILPADCAEKPVNFHASWWCSSRESAGASWYQKGVGDIEIEVIVGKVLSIQNGQFSGAFPDKDIYLDPSESLHVLVARMTDIYGTPCFDQLEQKCEVCTCPSGDFAFDDASTPDTIDPGGTISIYVSGGCPPYSWSTSSTGYSLGQPTTTGLVNTLTCASGTCGVNFDQFANVTVTDACGDSAPFTIRNTDGSWTQIENPSFGLSGSNCGGTISPTCYTTPNSYDTIDGDEKWTLEGMGPSPGGNCRLNPGADNWDATSNFPPPCGGPMACHPSPHSATCADPSGCTCYVDHYYYYTWQC